MFYDPFSHSTPRPGDNISLFFFFDLDRTNATRCLRRCLCSAPAPHTVTVQVLHRLRTARRTFEPPIYPRLSSSSTRQPPSIYERDLDNPRLNPDPLPQPCPHVWDATPMSPVSHAIQEGVGMLLGSAANAVTGRGSVGSVLGRFW
jgi:hypothetical protein